jgi:hypothetical protein
MLAQGVEAGRFLLAVAGEAKQRFLNTRQPGYRAILDALWQGANLLKLESFPTLLVELSLLEAQAVWISAATVPHTSTAAAITAPVMRRAEPIRQIPASSAPARSYESPMPGRVLPVEKAEATTPAPQRTGVEVKIDGPAQPEEPTWAKFLAEVKRQRLTTYTHVFNCSMAMAADGVLHIAFKPEQRLSYNAVQKPENAKVLVAAASVAYADGFSVAISISGQSSAEITLGGGRIAIVAGKSQEVPDELLADVVEEAQDDALQIQPSAADPEWLQDSADELYAELKAAEAPRLSDAEQLNPKRPVSAQEAMNLFEGVEIEDEE